VTVAASGDPVEGHTLKAVDHSLGDLRLHTVELGSLVINQVRGAIGALLESDRNRAREVLQREVRVNGLSAWIDHQVFECIALRQLVAGDLRLARAITRIVVDLERVGDEAKRLARSAERAGGGVYAEPVNAVAAHLRHMAELVSAMLHDALRGLDEADLGIASGVARQDENVDREFDAALRLLLTRAIENRSFGSAVIDTVFAAKALERIGDHAKNIAEQVHYYLAGDAPAASAMTSPDLL
jgi:phosphate transport system protein